MRGAPSEATGPRAPASHHGHGQAPRPSLGGPLFSIIIDTAHIRMHMREDLNILEFKLNPHMREDLNYIIKSIHVHIIIMHKTGPFTNSGVSKFVKLVVVYTKHQQLNL